MNPAIKLLALLLSDCWQPRVHYSPQKPSVRGRTNAAGNRSHFVQENVEAHRTCRIGNGSHFSCRHCRAGMALAIQPQSGLAGIGGREPEQGGCGYVSRYVLSAPGLHSRTRDLSAQSETWVATADHDRKAKKSRVVFPAFSQSTSGAFVRKACAF